MDPIFSPKSAGNINYTSIENNITDQRLQRAVEQLVNYEALQRGQEMCFGEAERKDVSLLRHSFCKKPTENLIGALESLTLVADPYFREEECLKISMFLVEHGVSSYKLNNLIIRLNNEYQEIKYHSLKKFHYMKTLECLRVLEMKIYEAAEEALSPIPMPNSLRHQIHEFKNERVRTSEELSQLYMNFYHYGRLFRCIEVALFHKNLPHKEFEVDLLLNSMQKLDAGHLKALFERIKPNQVLFVGKRILLFLANKYPLKKISDSNDLNVLSLLRIYFQSLALFIDYKEAPYNFMLEYTEDPGEPLS